jgi:LPXTG-site transpeptidase (sortase) family protein
MVVLRFSRRLAFAAAVFAAARLRPVRAEEHGQLPEVPSTGGRRPGPVFPASPRLPAARRGVAPVQMLIDKAAVDAPVEQMDIVDGVMLNPSGPWVVSWYHDLGRLGEGGNVVMAGHVDYWDVGPAVFWNLTQLAPGDGIRVVAEGGQEFAYALEWTKNYVVADMTQADFDEMLGDAGEEALTLITCAIGTFDEATQEYRERTVLRAMATT